MSDSPLGKTVTYPDSYDPGLLVSMAREKNRKLLGIAENQLPFQGVDVWNAYEISWLNLSGKPEACIGRFVFPCDSLNLIESKSLKLYLYSHNQQRYENGAHIQGLITKDLSEAAGGEVIAVLNNLAEDTNGAIYRPSGFCLDDLDGKFDSSMEPEPAFLQLKSQDEIEELVYTNLFRCNCPITQQPDWATVSLHYRGKQISGTGLLKYLVSYRQHSDYHEHCIERIFMDVMDRCEPDSLTVQANFLRRGGIDINPIRSTEKTKTNAKYFQRLIRQ